MDHRIRALPVLIPDSMRHTDSVSFFSPGFLSGYPMFNDFALVVWSKDDRNNGDQRDHKNHRDRSSKPELVVFDRNMGGNVTEARVY